MTILNAFIPFQIKYCDCFGIVLLLYEVDGDVGATTQTCTPVLYVWGSCLCWCVDGVVKYVYYLGFVCGDVEERGMRSERIRDVPGICVM